MNGFVHGIRWLGVLLIGIGFGLSNTVNAAAWADTARPCIAFSPYVAGYHPDYGPHPPHSLIERLLDRVIEQTPFRCIMSYGVLNGLDHVVEAARQRQLEVFLILWLDDDPAVNTASIAQGLKILRRYPDTVTRVSCGSELRTRHGSDWDREIVRCIASLKHQGITHPITSIDTWWEWCNRASPCQVSTLAQHVDWIGINVFAWWENHYTGLFPCIGVNEAAAFHLARLAEVRGIYPRKPVQLVEFGWPHGPNNTAPRHPLTGRDCDAASFVHQRTVITTTLAALQKHGERGVVFSAFDEPWKAEKEGISGAYWGICEGRAPFACRKVWP